MLPDVSPVSRQRFGICLALCTCLGSWASACRSLVGIDDISYRADAAAGASGDTSSEESGGTGGTPETDAGSAGLAGGGASAGSNAAGASADPDASTPPPDAGNEFVATEL